MSIMLVRPIEESISVIRYRRTLEQIAALTHKGQHSNLSANETLWHFVMIAHLANKTLYNPGQRRLERPSSTVAKRQRDVQSPRTQLQPRTRHR